VVTGLLVGAIEKASGEIVVGPDARAIDGSEKVVKRGMLK